MLFVFIGCPGSLPPSARFLPFAEMYLYGDLYETLDDEAKKRLGIED
jgi:hypothetical protein